MSEGLMPLWRCVSWQPRQANSSAGPCGSIDRIENADVGFALPGRWFGLSPRPNARNEMVQLRGKLVMHTDGVDRAAGQQVVVIVVAAGDCSREAPPQDTPLFRLAGDQRRQNRPGPGVDECGQHGTLRDVSQADHRKPHRSGRHDDA
jgi:hypothetical protein